MSTRIIAYTDGSSRGNPGPGGWGVVVADGARVQELGGDEKHTTNNRMELVAAIRALEYVGKLPRAGKPQMDIRADSRYVVRGVTEWLPEWEKRGWMTKGKKPVENRDLWEKLATLTRAEVSWSYVGGHVGVPGNERADKIATAFADGKKIVLYSGSRKNYSHDLEKTAATKKKVASKERSRGKAYSYVSLVDGVFKTHATWKECEARVKGVRGARFKKALSHGDEKRIRDEWSA